MEFLVSSMTFLSSFLIIGCPQRTHRVWTLCIKVHEAQENVSINFSFNFEIEEFMVLDKSLTSVYLWKKLNELNSVLYVILEIASKMLSETLWLFQAAGYHFVSYESSSINFRVHSSDTNGKREVNVACKKRYKIWLKTIMSKNDKK